MISKRNFTYYYFLGFHDTIICILSQHFHEDQVPMMYKNIIAAIGNTPLVKINFQTPPEIYAKLEHLNPGGSVKDRSALYMIEKAERLGLLKPGGTVIEASSGNQGIATAMIGAVKGYKVIITVFEKASKEKVQTLQAYGAQVIRCLQTEFVSDPLSYHSQAVAIQKSTPNSFMLNQYYNVDNAEAHYMSLGPEIWKQTNGTITHFFAAGGTGGTVSGTGKYLKEQNPDIKVICVDTANSFRATNGNPKPYKLEGIGLDFKGPVLNESVIDEFFCVTDEEALNMLYPLASKQGLLVGPSSAAVAYAAQEYSRNMKPTDRAVFIVGDSGRAYLSKGFYDRPDIDTQPTIKISDPSEYIQL